jgi:hypothetical protein
VSNPCPSLRAAVLICVLVPATACGLLGEHTSARRRPDPPPSPALARSEADKVLVRYELRANLANRHLSPQLATVALTGSALQLQVTKYRIARANHVRLSPYRYTAALSGEPMMSGYPRWFFAALTDTGSRPVSRVMAVFVQDRSGAQWRAAYTPITTLRVAGTVAAGVEFTDSPEVPAQDDARLALAPARLPGALADLLNNGRRSPYYHSIRTTPWIVGAHKHLGQDRQAYLRDGWSGSGGYAPGPFPTYAVRTTSGGALVWSAVDLRESYRHVHPGKGFTWQSAIWGDMLHPFIGHSAAKRSLTTGERFEFLAYVPPKGKGKVRFLADRWFPFLVKGR